jgi:protein-S-isoprenylcysteine O-methyltransferase Ste14
MHGTVTSLCWGVVVVTWIAGAVINSRNAPARQKSSEPGVLWRLGTVAVCGAIYLLARHQLHHIATRSAWVEIPGLALLAASTIFTLSARVVLGRMWSVSPDVLQDHHQLRTTGPYGITRHPIYTGLSGMLLGTAIYNGLGTWLILLIAGAALCATRVPIEERLMSATFTEEYAHYRERVPQLVPGLRLLFRATRKRTGS